MSASRLLLCNLTIVPHSARRKSLMEPLGAVMRRRDFIKVIAGSAAGWPLAGRVQQTGKLPTIGILGASSSVWGPWTAAFIGRLRELNWVEGRTIRFEYRWDEGHPERLKANAAELVRQND
jgi:putative ABC transport system substrate-binding protein